MATTIHFTLDDTPASLRAVRTLVDAFLADHDGKPSAYTQVAPDAPPMGLLDSRTLYTSAPEPATGVFTAGVDLLNSRTLEAAPPPPSLPEGWAPAPEVPGALVEAPSVELDSAGQPWNAEIHASSKAKVQDGTWRKKRGSTGTVEGTAEAPPPPAADAAPPPPPAADAAPPPPPSPAPVAGGYPTTIPQLMPLITKALTEGTVTMPQIAEACTSLGVATGLPGLGAVPEKIPELCVLLGIGGPA